MYPNARRATIIMYYSTIAFILSVIFGIFPRFLYGWYPNGFESAGIVTVLLMVIMSVLGYIMMIVSILFTVRALIVGARDDSFFRYGYILLGGIFVAIIILVASNIMVSNSMVSTVFEYIAKALNCAINVLIIIAISRLYKKMDDMNMVRHGMVTIAFFVTSALVAEIANFIADSGINDSRYAVLTTIGYAITLSRLILYSLFLRKARRTL